jgi:hypothetical protein
MDFRMDAPLHHVIEDVALQEVDRGVVELVGLDD